MSISIATININELRDDKKRRTLASISYNKTPTPRDALTPQFQLLSHPPELFHKFSHENHCSKRAETEEYPERNT
jgi:hypothetical protein